MTSVHLFPIVLRGVNTAEVESLPSYLHRVAFEHGVYTGEILRFLHRHGMREQRIHAGAKLASYIKVAEFVRPGRTTDMIRDLLQYFSGQDLSQTTLWVLDRALGRSCGEVVKGFRWCPECFSEMMSVGAEPYFKLIWHMSAISACPIHRTPLSNACEFCGCDQVSYKRERTLGHCQACGNALSKRKRRLRNSDICLSWQDNGFDIIRLFSELAETEPDSLLAGGAKKSIDDLLDYYWRNGSENVLYRAITRDEVLAIIHNQTPISLKSARRVAYRLGLSLFDLLSGNAAQTTDVLDHSQFCTFPPSYLDVTKKTKRDHRVILNRTKQLLSASVVPPSLKKLAEELGVSVGYLEYRHPALVQDVVSRHTEYEEHQRLKLIYSAQRVALEFFLAEKYAREPHSRKHAYRILRAETGLPKFLLKRSIQKAYSAVH